MKHNMRLNPEPFRMIKYGEKTFELRLYDEKRRRIKVGDEIKFVISDGTDSILCRVVALHVFSDFAALYRELPLLKCGYTADNVDFASPEDMDLYYSAEEQREHGVVGIEVSLITEEDTVQ